MDKVQCDGAIFTNDYKQNEKQPDWTGTLEIPKELLKDLVEKVKQGQTAELRVALWDRTSKNGKDYKYARMDIPIVKKQEEPKTESNFTDEDIPF
jgi:hypothetical protein